MAGFKVGQRVVVDIPEYDQSRTAQSVKRFNGMKLRVESVTWRESWGNPFAQYTLYGAESKYGIPYTFLAEWLREIRREDYENHGTL